MTVVWPDHHQLDSPGMRGRTIGARRANVVSIAGTTASKHCDVHAVLLVDPVDGVDFVVQVSRRVQGVPGACWDVFSHVHTGSGCGTERAGQEGGGRRDCVWSGSDKG